MIKLTFCIYRLPHMSQEEFLSYWLDTHGPLVKKHASTLNVRRYLQQHPADDPINEAIALAGRQVRDPLADLHIAEFWPPHPDGAALSRLTK